MINLKAHKRTCENSWASNVLFLSEASDYGLCWMELLKSKKAIKSIPGQHVSLCLSSVGPAYYPIEANAAILARSAAFLPYSNASHEYFYARTFLEEQSCISVLPTFQELRKPRLVGSVQRREKFHKSLSCRGFTIDRENWKCFSWIQNHWLRGSVLRDLYSCLCSSVCVCMHCGILQYENLLWLEKMLTSGLNLHWFLSTWGNIDK